MKKLILFFVLLSMAFSLYAFDPSLNGSWGLIVGGEQEEFIRFGSNGITLTGKLFRPNEYKESEDSVYIEDFDGDSVLIQYYRLSANKLLVIIINTSDFTESITLILTKF